jgi:hypothetical protein
VTSLRTVITQNKSLFKKCHWIQSLPALDDLPKKFLKKAGNKKKNTHPSFPPSTLLDPPIHPSIPPSSPHVAVKFTKYSPHHVTVNLQNKF